MRGKDHLFHLIHSLSKSEKRYFTLNARKSGKINSRYLKLFQLINKQLVCDEKPLKKQFGSRLGDDKARLYEAILGTMREYQSKKSYKARIKELLMDAKILFERKLYDQSENRLNEAKELAIELQDHLAVLEINLRQRQLIWEHLGKDYEEKVVKFIEEKSYHLSLLEKEFWLYDNLDHLAVTYFKFPYKLDDEEIDILKEKYDGVLKTMPDQLESFTALWQSHKFKALYFKLTGDADKAFNHFQEALRVWDLHPKIKSDNFTQYIKEFSNLLSAILRMPNRFSEFPALLQSLKEQKVPNIQGEKQLFVKTTNFELVYLLNSPKESIDNALQNIKTNLKLFNIKPSSEFSILSNTILLLFLNDRFKQCLSWLEKIWLLQKKNKNVRKDIQDHSRIIYLMAIQKIGTFDDMENVLRSTDRYFKRNKDSKLLAFYKLFGNTLKKLQAANSLKEEKKHLLHLKEEMALFKNKIHAGLDEICLLWVESLLQHKKIGEIRASSIPK